jgi:hypothetical protein
MQRPEIMICGTRASEYINSLELEVLSAAAKISRLELQLEMQTLAAAGAYDHAVRLRDERNDLREAAQKLAVLAIKYCNSDHNIDWPETVRLYDYVMGDKS